MRAHVVTILLLAAAVLPARALKDVESDAQAAVKAIAATYPEFHDGLLKYGRHLHTTALLARGGRAHRHQMPRGTALLKHAHNIHHRHQRQSAYAHPSVEKALSGMTDDLQSLKAQKLAAKEARGQLEGMMTDAAQHRNDAFRFKNAMAKEESKLRKEDTKLRSLEDTAGRLGETHDSLVSSLHRMIGPKLMFARDRLEKKETMLRKEETAAKAWREKRDQLKEVAMDLIKKKKASYQSLLEAEAEVARANKKAELARIQYEHDRTKTAEQVQSYRYAETRYKAELQHESTAKEGAMAARDTMSKLFTVEKIEQHKVDRSIMARKAKLQKKIIKIEAVREKDSEQLSGLERKYKEWKEKQRLRTAEVLNKRKETEAIADAYQASHKQVLENAQRKVAREAEETGDWDGWGSDFTKTGDETDD